MFILKRIILLAFWLFIGIELGIALIVLGVFLSLTFVLAFIGVPIVRLGFTLINPFVYLYL